MRADEARVMNAVAQERRSYRTVQLVKFAARMRNGQAYRAFISWAWVVRRCQERRWAMQHIVDKWRQRKIRASFLQWQRCAMDDLQREEVVHRILFLWFRRKLAWGFRRFLLADALEVSRRHLAKAARRQGAHTLRGTVQRAVKMWTSQKLARAMQSWKNDMHRARRGWYLQREAIQRFGVQCTFVLQQRVNKLAARQRLRAAIVQWKLASASMHVAQRCVKRVNKYILLTGSHIEAAESLRSLCNVTSDVVSMLLRGARGAGFA